MNVKAIWSITAAVAVSAIAAHFLTADPVQSQPRSQSEWGGESVGNPMDRWDTAYPYPFRDYGYDYRRASPVYLMAKPRKPRTATITIHCNQRGVICR